MALTETALDTLLGALDDVGDPGIVHIERLAARPARTGEPARPLPARGPPTRSVCRTCGATRWPPSTSPAPAVRWRWPPAPRRASRSATRPPSRRRCSTGCGPGTALCIYPTKALAQDQLRSFTGAGPAAPRGLRLRRGLHAGGPGPRPQARVGPADQPRDAALRGPPPPPALGDVPDAVALRRDRRAAHDAGHLRLARGPRAAPPAAAVRPLRVVAHVHLHVGDHRGAGPPRLGAVRPPGGGGLRRRVAEG